MTIGAVRLPLALLVEALWSYAAVALFVAIFRHGEPSAPSLLAVAAVVFGSFGLARALQETELSDAPLVIVGAVATAIAIFAILHLEYAPTTAPWDLGWIRALVSHPEDVETHTGAATVAMVLLWIRGNVRGRRSLDFDGVIRSAAFGVVPIAIAAGAAPPVHGPDAFGLLAIVYLPLALGALALYQTPDPHRPLRGYAAQWGAGVVAVLLIAAAFTVIAAAIDPSALGFLAPVGKPMVFVLGNAAKYIFGPPLAAIGWLLGFVHVPHSHPPPKPVLPGTPITKQTQDHQTPLWTRIIGWILAGGAGAIIGIVVLFVLWRLFRRNARQRDRFGERREQVEAESSLADDLGAAFNALARRFRRGARHTQSAVDVRRLYHEMLDRSAAMGLERPAAATPLQFAPRLDAHFASDVPSAISSAFGESRYGEHELDGRAVDDLRTRWEQAHTHGP